MWMPGRLWATSVILGSMAYGATVAAEEPANPSGRPVLGLYAGVEAKSTELAGGTGVLLGPQLCWTLSDVFAFGLSAFVLVPGFYPLTAQGDIERVRLVYGNLRAGYVFLPEAPVHPIALLLIGAGGASVAGHGDTPDAGAAVFLIEPALELEFAPRAWRSLRVGVAGSYRKVLMPSIADLAAASMSRWTGSVFVRVALF
jgi:hypothetical protein